MFSLARECSMSLLALCLIVLCVRGHIFLDSEELETEEPKRTRASFRAVLDSGTEIGHVPYHVFRCKKCKAPVAFPQDVWRFPCRI